MNTQEHMRGTQENAPRRERREIFFKDNEGGGYLWAWKESADGKVFGVASDKDEIIRRASRMFPEDECVLVAL